MKRGIFLSSLPVIFVFSFLSNAEAQNPYNLLLDSAFSYKWDNINQNWILSQKDRYSYIYDSGNQLIELDQYDNNGNLLRTDSRSYTDSTMVRILKNPYDGSWINYLKYFTLYDNMHKEIYSETFTWNNNEWLRADKTRWNYSDNNSLQLIRQYLFNGLFQDVQQIDYYI